MAQWQTISPEIARTHKLYGVGGWLILVVIGLFITPFYAAVVLYQTYRAIPDISALPQSYLIFIAVELLANAVMAIWAWTNLWLIFTKRAATVRSMIVFLAAQPIFVFVDAIVAKFMVELVGGVMSWQEVFDYDTIRTLGRSIVGAAIWIPYMIQSVRVNVTFLNRVKPNDPLSAQSNF